MASVLPLVEITHRIIFSSNEVTICVLCFSFLCLSFLKRCIYGMMKQAFQSFQKTKFSLLLNQPWWEDFYKILFKVSPLVLLFSGSISLSFLKKNKKKLKVTNLQIFVSTIIKYSQSLQEEIGDCKKIYAMKVCATWITCLNYLN